MRKNKFIVFEGIDGSGKSTQTKLLSEKLEALGHKVYSTFEPTDMPIGKIIRQMFSGKIQGDHRSIAALFAADRIEHLVHSEQGILQKLNDGYTVISDRYYFSSYAYHSVYMPMDWVIQINAFSAEMLRPDLNIYIDLAPETSMQRINANRQETEIYENLNILTQVRNNYLLAFEKLKNEEKTAFLNGNNNSQTIADEVWKCVQEIL